MSVYAVSMVAFLKEAQHWIVLNVVPVSTEVFVIIIMHILVYIFRENRIANYLLYFILVTLYI